MVTFVIGCVLVVEDLRARVRELERQLQQAHERPPSLGPHR